MKDMNIHTKTTIWGGYESPDLQIVNIRITGSVLSSSGGWDKGELNDSFNDVYDL